MRKRYINIIAVCMAALVVAACGKEQIQQIVPDPEPRNEPEVEVGTLDKLTVEAEVATKTTLNGSYVDWSDGDAISVFSTAHGVNHKFESSLSQDKHKAKFFGEIESGTTEMVAVYPYTSDAAYSGGKITGISIPTAQTATESSFANGASVTIAKATKEEDAKTVQLAFHNLCAVLQFTVPEGMEESSKIRVESINTDVKMSGAATIDIATSAITASESSVSYVELTGSFISGHTYCVTVAPGNYDQSFKFILTGKSGNSFERTLKVDGGVNAEKGGIYVIGALNPELADGAASISSCSIAHTYENSTLTGSVATITLKASVPDNEFANNIKGWKLKNVTMKDQNGTVYRTLDDTKFTNDQTFTLTAVSDKPYIPHGNYTISADIYYTVKKANGTDGEKKLKTVEKTVSSDKPDGSQFTLSAEPTGYTSYSVYMGYDDQDKSTDRANTITNDKIQGIGGKYTRGLDPLVYAQCSNLLSYTATYDGIPANGDSAEWLSWGEHKVKCTSVTFDGVTQSCNSEKTVHITGIPYVLTHRADEGYNRHPWSKLDGQIEFYNDKFEIYGSVQPIVRSSEFHIPETIYVQFDGKITAPDSNGSTWPNYNKILLKTNRSERTNFVVNKSTSWDYGTSPWHGNEKKNIVFYPTESWVEIQYQNTNRRHAIITKLLINYCTIPKQ